MELNSINKKGRWEQIAQDLNENFESIGAAVEQVKNTTSRNKGYFVSLDALNAQVTRPTVGDKAYVGSGSSYTVYQYTSSGWTNTGTASGNEVPNLDNYYTEDEADQIFLGYTREAKEIEDIAPTLVTEALRKTPQTLTDSEKIIARGNIGAASAADVTNLITKVDTNKTKTDTKLTELASVIFNNTKTIERSGSSTFWEAYLYIPLKQGNIYKITVSREGTSGPAYCYLKDHTFIEGRDSGITLINMTLHDGQSTRTFTYTASTNELAVVTFYADDNTLSVSASKEKDLITIQEISPNSFDDEPNENSGNLLTSGALYNEFLKKIGLGKLDADVFDSIIKTYEDIYSVSDKFVQFPGHIDISNRMMEYGASTHVVIPVKQGDIVEATSRSNADAHYCIVSEYQYGKSLPYNLPLVDGINEDITANTTVTITIPATAKYILFRATNNQGNTILPVSLKVNSVDIAKPLYDITSDLYNLSQTSLVGLKRLDKATFDYIIKNYGETNSVNVNELFFVGHVDGSNRMMEYGQAKHIVIPVKKDDVIVATTRPSAGGYYAVVSTYQYGKALPYNLDIVGGMDGDIGIGATVTLTIPESGNYILFRAINNNGLNILPQSIKINGIELMSSMFAKINSLQTQIDNLPQSTMLYERTNGLLSKVPIKADNIYQIAAWGQGAALVGNKIAGFNASNDTHTNYAKYNIIDLDTVTIEAQVDHNLGHVNSADFCNMTDCLVTCDTTDYDSENNKHTLDLLLIPGFKQILNNRTTLEYSSVTKISIPEVNGDYDGLCCFGERENIVYTVSKGGLYFENNQRWIYKFKIGMGSENLNDGTEGTYGTFISGKSDNEYNGTAKLLYVIPFESYMEIQGGKYYNGKLIFPNDVGSWAQAYITEVFIDEINNNTVVSKNLYIPTSDMQKTESEDCVLIGNMVLHQVIIHDGTQHTPLLFKYLL